MIGVPKIHTQDQDPTLILGDLEFGPPRTLDPKMTTYLSSGGREAVDELLSGRKSSETYTTLEQDDYLSWGVRKEQAPAVSAGVMGLSASPRVNLYEAESWVYFFDSDPQGTGMATRAYQHMICAGLAMGLDAISAEVRSDNERSIRLHERCGYVVLGSSPEYQQPYRNLVLYLYNPQLGLRAAVDHASQLSTSRRFPDFDPAKVEEAIDLVRATQDRLGYVQHVVNASQQSWRPFLESAGKRPSR